MRNELVDAPRGFNPIGDINLRDFGKVILDTDEQISISDGEIVNDITKKEWGFYITNSVNDTLKQQKVRTAIVLSPYGGTNKVFIQLVREDKMEEYKEYLKKYNSTVVLWADEMCEDNL